MQSWTQGWLRSLIELFCHTPIPLASRDSAKRFNSIVGIRDRMGQGRNGHVNYDLTQRSTCTDSPALHKQKKFEWFSWYFCLIHNLVPVQSRGMATHTHTAKHPHVGGCRHTDSTPTVSTSFNQVRMLPWEPNSEPPFLSLSFLSLCLLIHLCLLSLALPPQLHPFKTRARSLAKLFTTNPNVMFRPFDRQREKKWP